MPLVPEQLDVALTGGLETRTDRRLVQGKLLDLENLTFRNGTLSRRDGSLADGNGVVGGGTIADALALATRGAEVLRWSSTGVYSRASATAAPWVAKGDATDARPLSYALAPVASRARSCENFDCATLNGVSVYVWTEVQDTTRDIRATVVDDATGTLFQDAVLLGIENSTLVANSLVRVVASGSSVLVFYVVRNGSTTTVPLRCRRLDPASPTAFSSEVQVVTDVETSGPASEKFAFDAVDVTNPDFTGAMVAYTYSGADTVRWIHVANTGPAPVLAVPFYAARDPVEVLPDAIRSLRLFRTATLSYGGGDIVGEYIIIACHTNDTATMTSLDFAGDATTVGAVLGTLGGGFLRTTAMENTDGSWQAWLEPAPGTTEYRLMTAGWNKPQTSFTTNVTWLYNARLGGDAFTLGARRVVPLLYFNLPEEGSGVQPTYFLADASSARVLARVLPGLAGGPLQGVSLPRALPASSGAALVVPRRQRVEFNQEDGVLLDITPVGLVRMAVQLAEPATLSRLEENGALHVGGACPLYYDGATFVEDGFHLSPEAVGVTDGGAGNLSAGTRSWVVVYEWLDALGRLHRSAPSIPVRYTFGAGSKAASLTVPFLHLTRKSGVRLAVYRTTGDGSPTYYRVKPSLEAPNAVGAATTGLSATFLDDVADETILDNEVLYTVGGVLTAFPPPAYAFAHQHRGYLWLGGLMDDGYGFAYSLPEAQGEGPSWNDTLVGRLARETGPLRGFSTVDQTLALFTSGAAYVVTGEGPTATGSGNGFSEPARLTGALGLVDWRSLAPIPAGTLHKSPQGFQLLNRGLQVEDVGSGPERYDALEVVRGLNCTAKDEARFYTAEGRTLVWNYTWGQWSTFTLQPAVDAALVGSVPWYATGTTLRYETASTFKEDGQALTYTFGSSWLKARSLQGVQRVWRVLLLGEAAVDAVQVSLTVYTNYREAPAAESRTQSIPLTAGEPFQVRYGLSEQLAQAHRFVWSLTSTPSSGVDTGTLALTGMSLEVGTDGRVAKLKGNKSF